MDGDVTARFFYGELAQVTKRDVEGPVIAADGPAGPSPTTRRSI
jgi:hypothetical protein